MVQVRDPTYRDLRLIVQQCHFTTLGNISGPQNASLADATRHVFRNSIYGTSPRSTFLLWRLGKQDDGDQNHAVDIFRASGGNSLLLCVLRTSMPDQNRPPCGEDQQVFDGSRDGEHKIYGWSSHRGRKSNGKGRRK